ncbi:DoxX family protein [Brevibacterium sp. 50QC2O2]|uniref:DoxX family protein n=1 Tax=Brevibacterium sp. 50QC2O2 TaxID=2968459 RepID=UPI00211C15B0|nr:DoxX family protein [Brevibacterium sp. 50QC2O2]MCQ9387268.1 DoxX family protein [Brevibacterium sp. 50QC2O2]
MSTDRMPTETTKTSPAGTSADSDRRLFTLPTAVRDWVLLIARVLLGVVLIAHGYQKWGMQGFADGVEMFAGMGVPAPAVALVFALAVEYVGGALMILGLFTPIVGLLVVLDMIGAFALVHAGAGIFVSSGGWELVAVIALAAAAFAAVGPGRLSLDRAFVRKA